MGGRRQLSIDIYTYAFLNLIDEINQEGTGTIRYKNHNINVSFVPQLHL